MLVLFKGTKINLKFTSATVFQFSVNGLKFEAINTGFMSR